MNSISVRAPQRGFTLVELMVTLVLSSFLILGAFGLYLNNRQSYNFHESQQENLENGRFISLFMQDALGKIGYQMQAGIGGNALRGQVTGDGKGSTSFVDLTGAGPISFSSKDLKPCKLKEGQAVIALDDSDNEVTEPAKMPVKQICIRYEPRWSDEVDCLGNGLDAGVKQVIDQHGNDTDRYTSYDEFSPSEVIVERYWFEAADAPGNTSGVPALKCDAGHYIKTTSGTGMNASASYRISSEPTAGQALLGGPKGGVADLRFEVVFADKVPSLVRTFTLLRANAGGKNDRQRDFVSFDNAVADWVALLGGSGRVKSADLDPIRTADQDGIPAGRGGGHYLYRVVQNSMAVRNSPSSAQ